MSAEDLLRQVIGQLLESSADAWTRGAPRLAERLFAGAAQLLDGFALEPSEDADR